MARNDIHAVKNLITEDYEFVGCGWFGSFGRPGRSPLAHEARYLIDEGWKMGQNDAAGDCYHCGAHLTYYAIMKHLPTRELIRVGETCLANRFERATAEFRVLHKQAALDRTAHRIKMKRLAWFAGNPDREVAFGWAGDRVEAGDYGWEGTRDTFVRSITRYGDTSDKFVRLIMRDMARTERFEAERAARDAKDAAEATDVIEGRIVITGEVLAVKWQENDFGGRLVMTVKDDRGFKVWGSVPRAIEPKRGERVEFTGTVTKGDRDPSFGFFKRPSNAMVL